MERTRRTCVGGLLGPLGRFVAASFLVACVAAPRTQMVNVARRTFSEAALCPLDRVDGQARLDVTPPRRAVAEDPERLAMWRRKVGRILERQETVTADVWGCGERATYLCRGIFAVRYYRGRRTLAYEDSACYEPADDYSSPPSVSGTIR
jgi:hypothetical protein